MTESAVTAATYLIRYGAVPEVARFQCDLAEDLPRGCQAVIETHRGRLLGTVLERLRQPAMTETDFTVVRRATPDDEATAAELRQRCESEFPRWQARIVEWNLSLELVDLELTLDGSKQILYVLTERGPDTTNLALQAAAAGLGIIEVQPVSAEGLVALPSGGCGSGGGSCGCQH